MMLTDAQRETIDDLPPGWFFSHQDATGTAWIKKRGHRMTGGPDEFDIIAVLEDGQIEGDE